MTAYMVAQVQILDPERWERYKEIAAREIGRHGGQYLARGASPEVAEADWGQPENLQINIVAFAKGPGDRAGGHSLCSAVRGRHSVPLWHRRYRGRSGIGRRLCRRYLPGAVPYCRLNAAANANSDP
jgi:hypothetical protein